jgi:hypothetical protein
MAGKEVRIELPLVWIDPDSSEILFANQLLVQRQEGEYILTFGQQTPPPLIGTPEERAEQAKQIPYVPVRVAVRVATTRERMRKFVGVMQSLLDREEDE